MVKKQVTIKNTKDILNEESYKKYLKERTHLGKVTMIEKWKGFAISTTHRCEYEDCKRVWRPSPKRMFSEIGYCPSCVKSCSNKEDRFSVKPWTSDVPNTLYFYKLDYNGIVFHKIGRTEEENPDNRFPLKERKQFNMLLIDCKRLKLLESIKAENKFKKIANLVEFPDLTFHGKNETFQSDDPRKIWEECLLIDN